MGGPELVPSAELRVPAAGPDGRTTPPASRPLAQRLLEALGRRDFAALKALLARTPDAELLACWGGLAAVERAAAFKLLPRERALGLFARMPFDEQFLMIQAFPLESIAPLIEDAAPSARELFHRLTPEDMGAMLALALDG